MSDIRIVFDWPDVKGLGNNSTGHWSTKSTPKKKVKKKAMELTEEFLDGRVLDIGTDEFLRLDLVFFPPDNIWRDFDNIIGSLKSYQDGVFEALGIDDHLIRPGSWDWGVATGRKKGGWIVFNLTVIEWKPLTYEEYLKGVK